MVWDTKADFDAFYSGGAKSERWGRPGARAAISLPYFWAPTIAAQAGVVWAGVLPGFTPAGLTFPQALVSLLGLSAGDAVLLVGAGFNGTGEGLEALGIHVIGTDTSAYILREKDNTEEAEIREACLAVGVDPDTDLINGPTGPINPLDLFLKGGRAAPEPRGRGEILDEDLSTNGSRKAVMRRFDQLWPGVAPRVVLTEQVLNSITDAQAALVCDYCSAGALDWGASVVHMLSPLETGTSQAAALNWKTYQGWRAWLDSNGFASHLILPTVTATDQGMTFPIDNGMLTRVVAYSGLF